MLINSGARTDIPAFFSLWFLNRIRQGSVCVRNPYYPAQITRYRLAPDVVDCLLFCTKNPRPMLPHLTVLDAFSSYWFVTITPYGRDIEPHVPHPDQVIRDFQNLAQKYGTHRVCWRYDPIFFYGRYDFDAHLAGFEKMAQALSGYTDTCVISFISLYQKTKRNFPGVLAVSAEDKIRMAKALVAIGQRYRITIKTCAEAADLREYGVDMSGCLAKPVLEKAVGARLKNAHTKPNRVECACYPSRDIGAYNTCLHGCLYCYANYDQETVQRNWALHDPDSPLLIGTIGKDDIVRDADQERYADAQPLLF